MRQEHIAALENVLDHLCQWHLTPLDHIAVLQKVDIVEGKKRLDHKRADQSLELGGLPAMVGRPLAYEALDYHWLFSAILLVEPGAVQRRSFLFRDRRHRRPQRGARVVV